MKNIILITIDCLRKDHCGHNGHSRDTTPNIDALCADSYVFRQAVAPGPRTAESVPGILSGRLSSECDYVDSLSFKTISEDTKTLATFASSHGYRTCAAIANPQLSPVRGFNSGFDEFYNLRIEDRSDRFEDVNGAGNDTDNSEETGTALAHQVGNQLLDIGKSLPINPASLVLALYRHRQLRTNWPTIDGKWVIDRFIEQIPDGNQPFFAWTHLNDLHAPIHPQRAREGGDHISTRYHAVFDRCEARSSRA